MVQRILINMYRKIEILNVYRFDRAVQGLVSADSEGYIYEWSRG